MKNSIIKLLFLGVAVGSLILFSSCSSDEPQAAECTHEYGEWVVSTAPTCENDGIRTKTCTKCQLPVHEPVAALGHDYEVTEIITAATCEADGSGKLTCKNDTSHTKTDVLSKLGHSFSEWKAVTEATCYADGKEVRVCTNDAQHIEERTIQKTEHVLSEYTLLSPATCTENEKHSASCTNTGCTYTHVIEKEGTVGEHKLSQYVANTAASCTNNATQIASCQNPGCTFTDVKEIENTATGHRFDSYTTKASIDCSKDSTSISVCSYPECSVTDEKTIPNTAVGHQYDKGKCKVCQKIITVEKEWKISQSDEKSITAKLYCLKSNSYLLSFEGSGAIPDYSPEKTPWAEYSDRIEDLEISDGITKIGENAFLDFTALNKIVIGEAISVIGKSAFSNCYSLTQIDFNAVEMQDIGYVIFENAGIDAGGITFTVGNKVKSIPAYLFFSSSSDAPNVTSIIFSDSQEKIKIGAHSFRNLSNLTSITFTSAVTEIATYAFYGCNKLSSLDLTSSSVAVIGDYAFAGCTKITEFNASNTLNYIYSYAFSGCFALQKAVLGDNVLSIGEYAFSKCSQLSDVNLGKNLVELCEYAFSGCSSLSGISLPATLEAFTMSTFDGCNVITTQNGITYIDNWVIGCEKGAINVLSFKEGVVGFFENAFSKCEKLENLLIPSTLKYIMPNALNNSTNLKNIYYESSKADWSNVIVDTENTSINGATVLYYSEIDPKRSNTHWHYEDGKITVWDNWSDFTSPVIPLFEHSKD